MSIRIPSASELPTDAYYRSVYETTMNKALSQVPRPRIPIRYQPTFRSASERRMTEAKARREHATLTPSGRVSRDGLSPGQRVAGRREVVRENNLIIYLIRVIVASGIDEAPPRHVFTPAERDTRNMVAVGTRKIVAVCESIREVRRRNARPTSTRRVTPAKFSSVRSSQIKREGNASVL
jgi:hypothetical protein